MTDPFYEDKDWCTTTTDGTGTGVPRETKGTIYIAGKLSGEEKEYSQQEFYHYAAKYEGLGYKVINPWELEKLYGEGIGGWTYRDYIRMGLMDLLARADAIYMLPSWQTSAGARLEKLAAEIVGIPVFEAETGDHLISPAYINIPGEGFKPMIKSTTTVLEDARCVDQRMEEYGHPSLTFERIAAFWNAHLHERLRPEERVVREDVPDMMILAKLARLANGYHRDSVTDIAGYARTREIIQKDD